MKFVAILMTLAISAAPAVAQRSYLVKKLSGTARESDYTWIMPGQPIGIQSQKINLNFEQTTRSCRFLDIRNDTLIVRHIRSFRDTIVTWDKRSGSRPELFRQGWENGGIITKHRRLTTTRFQMPVESDTLFIPIAQINRIRSNRRSVQALSDNGMELGALLPPVFAYLMFINRNPARNYPMSKWKFMRRLPFEA